MESHFLLIKTEVTNLAYNIVAYKTKCGIEW